MHEDTLIRYGLRWFVRRWQLPLAVIVLALVTLAPEAYKSLTRWAGQQYSEHVIEPRVERQQERMQERIRRQREAREAPRSTAG